LGSDGQAKTEGLNVTDAIEEKLSELSACDLQAFAIDSAERVVALFESQARRRRSRQQVRQRRP
jgi:hypothetical protein